MSQSERVATNNQKGSSNKGRAEISTPVPTVADEVPLPANGELLVRFSASANYSLSIIVLNGSTIERTHRFNLVLDPLTNPKYRSPDTTNIADLSPGAKKVIVISNLGFILQVSDVVIQQNRTTDLIVDLKSNWYANVNLRRLRGTVTNLEGMPLLNARVTIRIRNATSSLDICSVPMLLANISSGAAAGLINEPGDEIEDLGLEDELEDLLEPYEVPSAMISYERRIYSDGTVVMSCTTDEYGTFSFQVKDEIDYVATIEFKGSSTESIINPSRDNMVVLAVKGDSAPSFSDIYKSAMRALILKDPSSYEFTVRLLSSHPREKEEFAELFRQSFDFYNKELPYRKEYLKNCERLSYKISLILSQDR